jgi:hypothetical protein
MRGSPIHTLVSSPIIVVCEAVLRSGAGSGSLAHLVD